jgi:hypothetical protein
MIRPFTCLCFLLACGAGLYLYQSKHRAQLLDREIEQTVHATEATRDQARLLNAEWMLLNDPERLRSLADQFLNLQTVKPPQFTTLADLDRRLPPVRSPDAPLEPVPVPAVMTPMVPMPVAQADQPPAPERAATPAPAVAAQSPARPAASSVAERKPAPERIAEAPAPHAAPAASHPPSERHESLVASAAPRPAPVARYNPPIASVVAPMTGGSALGMAAQAAPPPPQPFAAKPISLFQPIDH